MLAGLLIVATPLIAVASPVASAATTPKITLSPTSGGAGTSVTVNGTGFAPGARVTVNFIDSTHASTSLGKSKPTSNTGTFSGSVRIPDSAAQGTGYLHANIKGAHQYSKAPFTVTASSPAQIAVQTAFQQLGVPYTYGGASPQTGFDCSGLTMYSWAAAGVSLPHNSQAQYNAIPHVSQSQLQPGDLVFFYQPISHVGIYVGDGMMVHAPHTGGVVEEVAVFWSDFSGAGRP